MGDTLRQAVRVTLVGAAANLLLTVGKLVAGIAGHSAGLVADAANSAVDLFAGSAALFGLWVGHRPADATHPYGHRRFETETTRLLGLTFFATGAWLFWSAARSLWRGVHLQPEWITLWVALATIGLKEWLFHYTLRAGQSIKSSALVASAWDHRSDVFASLAAFLGILFARLLGWTGFDAVAALAVSGAVAWIGVRIYWDATSELVDALPSPGLSNAIAATAASVPGIVEVQDVKGRKHGPDIFVDIKVSVDGSLTVEEGHAIARTVKEQVIEQVDGVKDVLVHVNPTSR